jgi:hypothetical protein
MPAVGSIEDHGNMEWPEMKKAVGSQRLFSFGFGGNGGIRTLDEALHPILP